MKVVSRKSSIQIAIFFILRCIIASSFIVPFSSSSSSANRNNYNAYNYDQTTPQFTPDGRLLQVQYASSAANLSPPLIVLEFLSSSTNIIGDDDHQLLAYPCTVLITMPKEPLSPQNRIIIIENNDPDYDDKPNYSLSRNRNPRQRSYCVAMSGILADNLALLQAGMKVAAEHSLQYQDSLGMDSLAQALADECQSRVFAGGLRPYGSTLLLCGYDDIIMNDNRILPEEGVDKINDERRARKLFKSLIYQTDPSGGILRHHAEDGKDKKSFTGGTTTVKKKQPRRQEVLINNNTIQSQVRCIVGGSSSFQRQLRKQIDHGMIRFEQRQQQQQRNRKRSSFSLANRIANVARILIKETAGGNGNPNDGRNKSRNSKENASSPSNCPLEVVIISPRFGCHRLEGTQLKDIQDLIDDDK